MKPPRERAGRRRLRRAERPRHHSADQSAPVSLQTLIDAHGTVLALLNVLLARLKVIGRDEFADALAGLASVTRPDRPDEAAILAAWASVVKDAAETVIDPVVRR